MAVDRSTVAKVLDQIAAHLELQGENAFRVRAFRGGARTISSLAGEPSDWVAGTTLEEARGIGPAIQSVVREMVAGGRSSLLDELREHTPPGLVEMLGISGLGVAKVRLIHERLGVDSLPALEAAARDGRLADLPGFGSKTADNVPRYRKAAPDDPVPARAPRRRGGGAHAGRAGTGVRGVEGDRGG